MKTCLIVAFGILLSLICRNVQSNNEAEAANLASETAAPNAIQGKWKIIAAGDDANTNGILEDSEKFNPLEPGSYEILSFYKDGRKSHSGILGETNGTYEVKNIKGKKMILMYRDGMPSGLSEKEKEVWATRMEIRSIEKNKLMLVPPIYSSTLSVYTRIN